MQTSSVSLPIKSEVIDIDVGVTVFMAIVLLKSPRSLDLSDLLELSNQLRERSFELTKLVRVSEASTALVVRKWRIV